MTRDVPPAWTRPESYVRHKRPNALRITIKDGYSFRSSANADYLEPRLDEGVFKVKEDDALILHDQHGTGLQPTPQLPKEK